MIKLSYSIGVVGDKPNSDVHEVRIFAPKLSEEEKGKIIERFFEDIVDRSMPRIMGTATTKVSFGDETLGDFKLEIYNYEIPQIRRTPAR